MKSLQSAPGSIPSYCGLSEVRFPLPQLLQELEVERSAGSFSMEKLDQTEIGKLFKSRTPPRRVKPKK